MNTPLQSYFVIQSSLSSCPFNIQFGRSSIKLVKRLSLGLEVGNKNWPAKILVLNKFSMWPFIWPLACCYLEHLSLPYFNPFISEDLRSWKPGWRSSFLCEFLIYFTEADYCRKDKSLGVLSQKFLMMFLISEVSVVTIVTAVVIICYRCMS